MCNCSKFLLVIIVIAVIITKIKLIACSQWHLIRVHVYAVLLRNVYRIFFKTKSSKIFKDQDFYVVLCRIIQLNTFTTTPCLKKTTDVANYIFNEH